MVTIARNNWTNTDTADEIVHKNDIWLENGSFAICSGFDCYSQTVEAVIKTIRGEIQTAKNRGVPYFRTVFNNNRGLDAWASAVRREVLGLDFVSSISSFTYNYDFPSKRLIYELTIITDSHSSVTVNSTME